MRQRKRDPEGRYHKEVAEGLERPHATRHRRLGAEESDLVGHAPGTLEVVPAGSYCIEPVAGCLEGREGAGGIHGVMGRCLGFLDRGDEMEYRSLSSLFWSDIFAINLFTWRHCRCLHNPCRPNRQTTMFKRSKSPEPISGLGPTSETTVGFEGVAIGEAIRQATITIVSLSPGTVIVSLEHGYCDQCVSLTVSNSTYLRQVDQASSFALSYQKRPPDFQCCRLIQK